MAALTRRRAVFLDRDGTLNRLPAPGEYLSDPDELELMAGAADAVALLREHGFACVVVSNQRGVALGRMTDGELDAVDARLHELLELDGSFYCRHGLEPACACRKPKPGLILDAARALDLDLAASWMVGDSDSDVEAGRRAGCRAVRVEPADMALWHAANEITDPSKGASQWQTP